MISDPEFRREKIPFGRMLESAVNGDSAGKLKTMCESIGLDVWDASRPWAFYCNGGWSWRREQMPPKQG